MFTRSLVLAIAGLALGAAVPGCASSPRLAVEPDESEQPAPTAVEYIEYRSQPLLGRITISDHVARGERAAKYLLDNADALTKQGILAVTADARRDFLRRSETVGGRTIETLVVLHPTPPAGDDGDDGSGADEASYGTQRLLVIVDGRLKVNTTIGYSADGELWVSQVVVHPEEGTLEITALSADGVELTLPDAWLSLDDRTVITDDSFYDDVPAEGTGRVKV